MHAPHILLVDDCPAKMGEMESAALSSGKNPILHKAENVREALNIIDVFGEDIDAGGIDYDLPDGTGADVIAALHSRSRTRAHCALFTARNGAAFEAAAADATASGADAAYSAQEHAANVLLPHFRNAA